MLRCRVSRTPYTSGLKKRGLWEHTDLLVVSDHGMTALSRDCVVNLDLYTNTRYRRQTFGSRSNV